MHAHCTNIGSTKNHTSSQQSCAWHIGAHPFMLLPPIIDHLSTIRARSLQVWFWWWFELGHTIIDVGRRWFHLLVPTHFQNLWLYVKGPVCTKWKRCSNHWGNISMYGRWWISFCIGSWKDFCTAIWTGDEIWCYSQEYRCAAWWDFSNVSPEYDSLRSTT